MDALEIKVECLRQRADQQCLGQSWHTGEQDVFTAVKAQEHVFDNTLLSHDSFGDFLPKRTGTGGQGLN